MSRILFIVDNDFGSLGLAMMFLHRQSFAKDATILLSERLYAANKDQMDVDIRPYQSLADIKTYAKETSPGTVFLCSAYLYGSQRLLSSGDLSDLIGFLQRLGCQLTTTDPFLGALSQVRRADFKSSVVALSHTRFLNLCGPLRPLALWLIVWRIAFKYAHVANKLIDLIHLYPAPAGHLSTMTGKRQLSFFNSKVRYTADELKAATREVSALPDISSSRKRWLFVIAEFDLAYQYEVFGESGFANEIRGKLQEVIDAGKHAVLIAPAGLISLVSCGFKEGLPVSFMAWCPFREFTNRLLDAEVVFYWQVFSTSSFLRLINGLPVYYYDPGHYARMFNPAYRLGTQCYYGGEEPTYLKIDEDLDVPGLIGMKGKFQKGAIRLVDYMSQAHAPEDLLPLLS